MIGLFELIDPLNTYSGLDAPSLMLEEFQWHYSQHFFAERCGEEVIEDLLLSASDRKQRLILIAQLKDETRHTALFQRIVDRAGLVQEASGYAKAYSALVKTQKSFAEKVFCFQIMTEAVSEAYCQWRVATFKSECATPADLEVLDDERRHLAMGMCVLGMLSPDEIERNLGIERRSVLIREMNEICLTSSLAFFETFGLSLEPKKTNLKSVDRYIAKNLVQTCVKLKGLLKNGGAKYPDLLGQSELQFLGECNE